MFYDAFCGIVDLFFRRFPAQAETDGAVCAHSLDIHGFQHRRNLLLPAGTGTAGRNKNTVSFQGKQHGLAADRFKGHVQDMRSRFCRIGHRAVDNGSRNLFGKFLPQADFESAYIRRVPGIPCIDCGTEGQDAEGVFRSGTEPFFLSAAEDYRMKREIL